MRINNALKYIEGGNNIMYTFTILVHIANVYIMFLPPFNFVGDSLRQTVRCKDLNRGFKQ